MNTVPKGTNRAGAAAKRSKHAQRTPLPPRTGQVEDAKEVISYGKMTRPQLFEEARRLGLAPPASAPKGKLLEAILQKERADRAAARLEAEEAAKPKAKKVSAAQATPTKGSTAHVESTATGTRSEVKAEAFRQAAIELGWKVSARTDEGERTELTVSRGEENIDISWEGGVFQHPCLYSHLGRTVQLRNASAAKQRMGMEPEKATEEATRVVSRKHNAEARKSGGERRVRLPFDPELATDVEILAAVQGKRVTWTNGISGADYSDVVTPDRNVRVKANRAKIDEGPRGRILNFVGDEGFHSILVTKITSVR